MYRAVFSKDCGTVIVSRKRCRRSIGQNFSGHFFGPARNWLTAIHFLKRLFETFIACIDTLDNLIGDRHVRTRSTKFRTRVRISANFFRRARQYARWCWVMRTIIWLDISAIPLPSGCRKQGKQRPMVISWTQPVIYLIYVKKLTIATKSFKTCIKLIAVLRLKILIDICLIIAAILDN